MVGPIKVSPKRHLSMHSAFGSHNRDASFSSLSADFCFSNYRLPRESWSWERSSRIFITLLWFWRRWSENPLVYLLQSYISMSPTGFNEGKWICHWSSQLSWSPYVRLPTYAGKTEIQNQLVLFYYLLYISALTPGIIILLHLIML